jgi:hypothetical protein
MRNFPRVSGLGIALFWPECASILRRASSGRRKIAICFLVICPYAVGLRQSEWSIPKSFETRFGGAIGAVFPEGSVRGAGKALRRIRYKTLIVGPLPAE